MTIETDLKLPSVVSKPYPLPLKHHTFMKEEIKTLLETGLFKRLMRLYAGSINVVPRKRKSWGTFC